MMMTKTELYGRLLSQFDGLLQDQPALMANAADTDSLIYQTLPELNWAGFYFLRGDKLLLGPFQEKPACARIAVGEGVCGQAAGQGKTIVLDDVHRFPGHIACDGASNSEIVVPLVAKEGRLIGVLDLDSLLLGRFDADDRAGLERLAEAFLRRTQVDSN